MSFLSQVTLDCGSTLEELCQVYLLKLKFSPVTNRNQNQLQVRKELEFGEAQIAEVLLRLPAVLISIKVNKKDFTTA